MRLRAAWRGGGVPLHPPPPAPAAPPTATVGRWTIDLAAHTATSRASAAASRTSAGDSPALADRESLRLTPTEWQILEVLLRRPGQLVSSARLLAGIWGPGYQNQTNYLRFHMARLRRKLEDDPARPRHLLTEPGMGYRYQP